MSAKSTIPWTEETANPCPGCWKVSPGCLHCYAETMAKRLKGMGVAAYQDIVDANGWTGKVGFDPDAMHVQGKGKMVFVNSMGDLFYEGVTDEQRDQVFGAMLNHPEHTYQILTKRPKLALGYYQGIIEDADDFDGIESPLPCAPNIWLGVSCENRATANDRLPLLLQIPAAVRFVSLEPLLGLVELRYGITNWRRCMQCGRILRMGPGGSHPRCDCIGWRGSRLDSRELFPFKGGGLDWVIVGAESLNGRPGRSCPIEWIQTIVQHCEWDRVPVFVKQLHHEGKLIKDPQQMADILGTTVDQIRQWPESRKAD